MRSSPLTRCWLAALLACSASPPRVPPEPSERMALPAPPAPPPAPSAKTQRSGAELDPLLTQKLAVARGDASIGRTLGVFRNTYYDFPLEREYTGPLVDVFDPSCRSLARVPREFHDTLCMQGSGLLADGRTLSFARRDCRCARRCPRSSQRICYEALPPERYPWGRGATGEPITPLLSVAVDVDVIPLGTPLFIPDYLGLPRGADHHSEHDGCFIAQDRGIKIQGRHIDVFTGEEAQTEVWNRLVPSNRGVTVIVDSPFCERLGLDPSSAR
ncbi:MAG TPA: 3D domain-containing protein [Polyangiaceae bacterium]|nr:3D domain-containing protein [Polyangiaceae bacterium]